MPDLLFSSGQLNWREATLTEKNMKGGSDLQSLASHLLSGARTCPPLSFQGSLGPSECEFYIQAYDLLAAV